MSDTYILVLYYSKHGSVENLAKSIAKGIESAGLEARIRTVPSDISSQCDYPEVTKEDLCNCAGLAMGSPSHFGMMASPLKAFWETTSTEWLAGKLIDKPAAVFTSSSSFHGGNEATLLTLSLPLLHHGMMLLGVPYSEPSLHNTKTGGTPYGASHVSGLTQENELSEDERTIAINVGKRIANMAQKLI